MDYTDNPRVKVDADGTMYVDGVEVRVNEFVIEDKKSMTAAYRDLKNSLDMGAISQEEFYSELEVLRDTYLAEGSAAWWSYTKKILAYEQSLKQEQIEAQMSMIDAQLNRMSSLYALGEMSAQQYYDRLTTMRDQYFTEGSKEWTDFTNEIGKLYVNQLEKAEKAADTLTDRLAGGLMQSVTIKDKSGKVTDRFYRLMTPDENAAKKFFEGYEFLQQNGAPSFVTQDYLSMSPEQAASYYDAVRNLGDRVPQYMSELSESRNTIQTMAEHLYGADVLADVVSQIIQSLKDAGLMTEVEINQSFYGQNLTPSEVARETTNALRLQGVGL